MADVSADFSTSVLEDEGSADSPGISTPVDTAASTLDSARSRRSARRKQCNFSSDFEYYSPGTRKKMAEDELKVDTDAAPKGRRRVGRPRKNEKQQMDVEEPIENEEDNNQGQKKRQIRKVAVKMQKKKVFEKEELDDFEEDSSLQIEVGIVKGAAKTTAVKGKKVGQKKKINPNVELSAKDEGSDKGESKEKDDNKPVKGQKRKKKEEASKVARKKVKSKKLGAQEGEPSDEETEQALPFKVSTQRKMPKLKKQMGASSPPSLNLMEKLAEVSSDSGSVPDLLPVKGPKRKLGVASGDIGIPSKTARSVKKNKQALAAAGLIRRIPESDQGMPKLIPAVKTTNPSSTTAEQKISTAAADKIPDSKTSVNTVAGSGIKPEVQTEGWLKSFAL